MKAGEFLKAALKTTKGKAVAIGGGATVAAVSITAAVLMQGEGYRSIAVQEVTGTVSIIGEQNNGQAFVGEHLYSGDDVTVGDASELTMCMDNDKYVYADANTHFNLQASAADEESRIKIYLDEGSELNVLQTALNENETYEVDTPNSTMAVRGTTFRVTVYTAADGMVYTLTEVSEGTVKAQLKTKDGKYIGVERDFTAGESALIRGNEEFSEFVSTDMIKMAELYLENSDDDEALLLAYGELPEDGLDRLITLLEEADLIDKTDKTEEIRPKEDGKKAVTPAPMPTISPTPSPEPVKKAERTEIEALYNEWVVEIDSVTGAFILKDGTIFDPDYYAKNNPDVVANFGSDPKILLWHYLMLGRNEGRPGSQQEEEQKKDAFLKFAEILSTPDVTPTPEPTEELQEVAQAAAPTQAVYNNNLAAERLTPAPVMQKQPIMFR